MANMFNEDGTYNKTEWKAGDKITAVKLNKIELSLEAINNNDINRHVEADTRLDALEESMENSATKNELKTLETLVKDNKDATDLEFYSLDNELSSIKDTAANNKNELEALIDYNKNELKTLINTNNDEVKTLIHTSNDEVKTLIYTSNDEVKTLMNDVMINIRDFGVIGDGEDETEAIQYAFDNLKTGQILYFPVGDYRTRGIIFKNSNGYDAVKIKGESRSYLIQDDLEDNPRGCTTITYIGDDGGNLFDKLEVCMNYRRFYVDSILFKGCERISDSGYQENHFIYTGRNGSPNGAYANVYANDCEFWGFKTVCGEYAPYDYGGENDQNEFIEQTNIYATCCKFTRNKHALSNIIDSYIERCVFNLNDVAIILRKWGLANRILNNRFEWNIEHSIYISRGESLIEANEFDRSGYCGVYMSESKSSCIIGNKFLRNGASEKNTNLIDYVENIHIYFNSNTDCIVKGNLMREERQWDDGSGEVVPYKCGRFTNNVNCVITDNVLTGGFIKYEASSKLNMFKDNKYCIIDNVMYNNIQTSHKPHQASITITSGANGYVVIPFIDIINTSSIGDVYTLSITCLESEINDYEHTTSYDVYYILFDSTGNQGYIRGETIKKIGRPSSGIPFEIENFDYFKNDSVIGINLRNTTSSVNKYLISFK